MTLPAERSTIVLGAGVAGLSVALYLQRSGHAVTVIDPLPPGTGSSYGNSGLISADTAVPIAMPGMLQKVPRWLSDPLGPLAVRPAYFPRALPWLMRWIGASREPRVLAISGAMRAMHAGAFDCWRELLGDALYAEFIRRDGQVKIWEGEGVESALELEICRRHDIPIRMLGQGELQDLYPGLAPDIRRGMLMPGNGCTVNPRRLVATLADLLQQAGGQLVHEQALRIVPRGGAAGQMVLPTSPTVSHATSWSPPAPGAARCWIRWASPCRWKASAATTRCCPTPA